MSGSKQLLAVKIKTLRESRDMTQADLAQALGVKTSAISNYEHGYRVPDLDLIEAMADIFNVPMSYLLDVKPTLKIERNITFPISVPNVTPTPLPDEKQDRIAEILSSLSSENRMRLIDYAELLLKAQGPEKEEQPAPAEVKPPRRTVRLRTYSLENIVNATVRLRRYDAAAAAGEPNWVDSDNYTDIDYPLDVVPRYADFALLISGHSMEPEINDGETVFVHKTETDFSDGHIVIAWIDGEGSVCKRARKVGGKLLRLESINPFYPSFEGAVLKNVRIYGRVVGRLETKGRYK